MSTIPPLLVFCGILTFAAISIVLVMRKGVLGLKLILAGIGMLLLGGIIAIDPESNYVDVEYLVILIGLIYCIFGLRKSG